MTLINRIYAEIEKTPWFSVSQIAFALGTSSASITSTCRVNGTTFNKIKASEIQRLKNLEAVYRIYNQPELEAAE